MDYNKARKLIKSGDILAWSHRGGWFRSWNDFKVHLVRLFLRSEYSHVGIAVVFGGRVFVLESVKGGIRLLPLSKAVPCYWIKYRKEFDLARAMTVCGEDYSELEAMLGRLGLSDDTNSKWQCAEFVRWAHELDCYATPSDVVRVALQEGGIMQELG